MDLLYNLRAILQIIWNIFCIMLLGAFHFFLLFFTLRAAYHTLSLSIFRFSLDTWARMAWITQFWACRALAFSLFSRPDLALDSGKFLAESFDACPILLIRYEMNELSILCLKLVWLIKLWVSGILCRSYWLRIGQQLNQNKNQRKHNNLR